MRYKYLSYLKELVWLIISLVITLLISLLLFKVDFTISTVDLYVKESYYIFQQWTLLLPLYLFINFLIYLIKTATSKNRSQLERWILLISGLALVLTLTFLIKTVSQTNSSGWTVYPPLSQSGPTTLPDEASDPELNQIGNILLILQAIILLILFYSVYTWKKR